MPYKLIVFNFVISMVALSIGILGAAEPTHYPFAGRVMDISGAPIDGAQLRILRLDQPGESIVTHSKQGRYEAPALADGEYSLEVTSPGFLKVTYSSLRIIFPNVFNFDVTMRFGPVFEGGIGTVDPYQQFFGVLRRKGTVISNARVCLIHGETPRCSITNTLGQYLIKVPPSTYIVSVELEGRIIFSSRFEVNSHDQYRNAIQLE